MTKKKLLYWIVGSLILIGLGSLVFRVWFAAPDAPTAGVDVGSEEMMRVVNGMRVTASDLAVNDDQISVRVCFDLPDNRDWTITYPDSVVLAINDYEYPWSGGTLVEMVGFPIDGQQSIAELNGERLEFKTVPASPGNTPHLCNVINFEKPKEAFTSAKLVIHFILGRPRGDGECSPTYIDKAQQVMDSHQPGIIVGCTEESFGVVVLEKPDDMTLEEADSLLHSREVLIDIQGVRGPWVFDFVIEP